MTLNRIKTLLEESQKTGRPIEYRQNEQSEWRILPPDDDCVWSRDCNYRVAPPEPPKPRDLWMIPGRKEGEFLAYPDDGKTPREHWKQAGYTLVREVMEDSK